MDREDFLKHLERGEVPPSPPHTSDCNDYDCKRIACRQYGMYAIVSKETTKELAEWIGKRSVLEVMAGAGWLAKALEYHGCSIRAVDNWSWETTRKSKKVFPVSTMTGLSAVRRIPADILLMCWPYMDNNAHKISTLWGTSKPIVYIGEEDGGCTGDREFHSRLRVIKTMAWPQWCGLHDRVQVGYYDREPKRDDDD